jgi:hypothetical protein
MTRLNIEKLLMTSQAISPVHREDLESSLITLEAAKVAGIKTAPPDAVPKILGACNYGWAAPQVESMLAFPYRSLNGDCSPDNWRFKLFPPISTRDGKTTKYLQPSGTTNHLYCPPGVYPQGNETIYVTEGEKKTLCLTLQGFPCLGLGGVWGWRTRDKDGNSKVIPDFEAVTWQRRDVVIVFDADIAINENLQRAEAELAQELISRKARVFVMRLPYSPGCAKGVDDYLKEHGKDAFAKLPRKPVKPRKKKDQTQARVNINPDSPLAGTPYLIENGRICFLKQVGGGRNVAQVVTPLCNFVARCDEEIIRDDGRETTREFIINGTLDTGQTLPPAAIKSGEFRGMGWVGKHWGMAANLTAGQSAQDRVREAIQHLSRSAKQRVVYTHSGWRKLNGIWVFLHGGGAINGKEGVEVDLGPELSRYRLPPPGGKKEAEASFQLLDIGPLKVTAPFLSSTYLAPLSDQLKIDFTLWPLGPTGSLKSTLAALYLSHFGLFDRLTLPGQWSSTANALERRAFVLKDFPFVIDDFAPQQDARKTSDLEAKAHRIIRAAGNRVGRQRLSGDMTERQTYDPRCLIISTGEMTPTGESLAARYFSFEIDRQMIDMARLTKAQNDRHLLSQAMSAYLAWLAENLEEILLEARETWEAYRTAAQTEAHPRVPEMVAWLMLGFELFLRFMAHMGVISDTYELEKVAWETFTGLAQVHGKLIEGERPTRKFLNILRELFIQKRVYLLGTDGICPQNFEDLGWKAYEDPGMGEHIGWVDEGYLYLMPETTLKVIQDVLRRQGDYLGIGKNTLFKSLAKEKIIEPGLDGKNTRQKKIKERNERVLYMVRGALGGSGNGSAE